MNIDIKTTHIELTVPLREYIEKRLDRLSRVLPADKETHIYFDLKFDKGTKEGIYHTDCKVTVAGGKKIFYAGFNGLDMNECVDELQEILFRDIRSYYEKKKTLFERGARSVKKRLKGLKAWGIGGGK
ncbi:MAG: ribosomal subunit interface protein [Flavobacteriaceae bacterium]|jgi:ribosomal subunit interface protein